MILEIHGMDNIQREDNPKILWISSTTQQIGTEKKGTEDADTRNPIPIVSDVDALLSNSKIEIMLDNNYIENKATDKGNPVLIITNTEMGNSKSSTKPLQEKEADVPNGLNPTKSKST